MKKLMALALIGLATFTYANVNTVVSILPQKTFVKAIGGDKVNVRVMVLPGKSPHNYEPKASQMKDIAKADLYFTIGVEFEHVWMAKFSDLNKKMKVINSSSGVTKIAVKGHHHHEHKEKKEHNEHEEESLDPHIWTSTTNVEIIARNILESLINLDSKNQKYYTSNYNKFVEEIQSTDKKIKQILLDTRTGTKFMVFHPSWGYFANDYGLNQFAIESGGKNPKAKHIAYLIEEAKEENVKVIFTAPEFSDKIATLIAKQIGIKVLKVSSLDPKWSQNLINLAKAIAQK